MLTLLIFTRIMLVVLGALLVLAAVLHLIPRLGARGRSLSEWLCRAPGLDVVITYFTALPLIAGPVAGAVYLGDGFFAGFAGLLAAIIAQVLAVLVWTEVHEIFNARAVRGPRIVKVINARVGRVRNHAAVWTTALCVPVFWIVRLAEYVVYPPLVRLVGLPPYEAGDWVNVSRHKFHGLVGHDLIWCLYCDWMTGVWSLGTEMLRNVESFWCPIRFDSTKKCENCRIDFPDVETTWIPAGGTMQQVANLLEDKLGEGNHSWHSHPTRLTVHGKPPESTSRSQQSETPESGG